jgi:hypothetical protein
VSRCHSGGELGFGEDLGALWSEERSNSHSGEESSGRHGVLVLWDRYRGCMSVMQVEVI